MSKQRSIVHRIGYILLILTFILSTQCQQKKTTEPVVETIVETPLDAYVYTPDPAFHYEVAYQGKKEGYTFYVLKMISQKWLTEAEVDEPIWWHWVKIVVPDTIWHDTGMMWIGGGAKDDELPDSPGQILLQSALLTKSISA